MTSGQFAPLLPIVAQVVGIDINKWKLLVDDLKRYISLQNYDFRFCKANFRLHHCIYMWLCHTHKSKAFVDIRFPIIN